MSMENSNDIIGNRTRDLPACSAVPQPSHRLLRIQKYCHIFFSDFRSLAVTMEVEGLVIDHLDIFSMYFLLPFSE